MANRCPTVRGLCRLRVTRLDSLGNVDAGSNNVWVSNGMIEIGVSPEIEEGERFTLKNGCGDILADFAEEDRRIRYNLELTTGLDEPGLREILLGDDVITDGSDIIGTSAADQTDTDFVPSRVAVEAWVKLIDGDAQDAVRPWLYVLFPSSSWVEGDNTIGEEFWTPGYTGKSRSNQQWGDGPHGDVGVPAGQLGPIANFVQVDVDPPTADCGYDSVSPSS